MRPWSYVLAGVLVIAIGGLIYTNNRNDATTVDERSTNTSASLSADAVESMFYVLSPAASIQQLLDQGTVPEEAVPLLQEAQRLYEEALTKPASDAIPLLEQCESQLNQASDVVGNAAEDASNQVSQENLKRLSSAILVIRDRVVADRQVLEATGTPAAATTSLRDASWATQ